jgi:hypothetical protein
VRRLYCDRFRQYFTGGHNGPVYGFLLDHPVLQDIVDVAPDRNTALARFRCFMQAGTKPRRTPPPTPSSSGGRGESTKTRTCAKTVSGN